MEIENGIWYNKGIKRLRRKSLQHRKNAINSVNSQEVMRYEGFYEGYVCADDHLWYIVFGCKARRPFLRKNETVLYDRGLTAKES